MKYLQLIAFIFLFACEAPIDPLFKGTVNGYRIHAGDNHSSGRMLNTVFKRLDFNFNIQNVYVVNDSATSQIYGISDAGRHPHLAARVRSDSTIDVFAAWYEKDKFKKAFLGNIKVNTWNIGAVEIRKHSHYFRFNEKIFIGPREPKWFPAWFNNRLFPRWENEAPFDRLELIEEK